MSKKNGKLGIALLFVALTACGAKDKDENSAADDGEQTHAGAGGRSPGSGSGGHGGATPKPMDDCPATTDIIDPTAIIDDFEDGDAYLTAVDGRNGGWWTAGDGTPGATLVPEPSDATGELAAPELLPEPRCGSRYAMRVTGQGFADWGAMLGVTFAFGTRPNGEDGAVPYDASGRTGVDFWARIGDTSTNRVRYEISDSNSEPDGGVCKENGAVGEQCYDSFGAQLTSLDTNWHHYRIPFSGMSQRNFGVSAPGLVQTAIYNLTFGFSSADPFDFWVDDLSFY